MRRIEGDPPEAGTEADVLTVRVGPDWLIKWKHAPIEAARWLFDPVEIERRGLLEGTSTGRRSAWFLNRDGTSMVLRHYWRGGAMAKVSEDRFAWQGVERSRPYREMRLLVGLFEQDLPVPRPVAARVAPKGLTYSGDILTVTIPTTHTLADRIHHGEMSGRSWVEVGRTIRRFHDAGAYHADLNVRNILIDDDGLVWLIDWDKGRRRRPGGRWTRRTIRRLHRSLLKEPELAAAAREHWTTMLRAWESG